MPVRLRAGISVVCLCFLFASALVAGAATLTVQTNQLGPTPDLLGYNSGHFYPGSNTREWWRYSGVTGARFFISPSNIEPSDDLAPVGDGVNSQATFLARRAAIRTNQFNPAYINWSVFNNNYQNNDLAGNNHIKVNFALGELRKLGVRICAQITASTSRLPLSGAADWPNMWELWQHYYVQAFYLGRYFDVERYQMYNEPNHSPAVPQDDYMIRLRLASDAIQLALADVNSLYGKSLVPTVLAPVSSGSAASPYSDWGTMVVTNRHLNVIGDVDPSFWLLHVYDYHQYNAAPSSFGSGLATLQSLIAADMAPEAPFPTSISEFNTYMAASFDTMTDTLDSPSQYPRFGAVVVNLMANSCSELYCFKFSQTEYSGNYPVTKNAMHYVDNDTAPYNIGGITKAGEVWRLFNKAFPPGRQRLSTTLGSGATALDVHASYDPASDRYYLFAANNTTSDVSLSLALGAWGIPTNNLVLVDEVSEGCYGGGRIWTNAGASHNVSATLGSNSVWLLTAPRAEQQPEQTILAIDDAEVRDGANKGVNFGSEPLINIRNDPANASNRSAGFLKFQLPTTNLADLRFAVLSVYASGTTDAPIQAHVYGIDSNNWSQSTLRWTNAPNLKNNWSPGPYITNNFITGLGTNAHLAGQLVVASADPYERLIDVTDFIRGCTNSDASFLISQDPRWNVTLPLLEPGDTQPGGIRIVTQEGAGPGMPGPRLHLVFNVVTNSTFAWTNLPVATEAFVRGGVNAATDQDEAATGYILVKYYAAPYDSARKAYFQFDLSGLKVETNGSATFTVTTYTQAYQQRVQLWGLNQAYPGFAADVTWNTAQANEVNSNNLLTNGTYNAEPIGDPAFIPGTPGLQYSFTIPRIGDYIRSNRVTLALGGLPDSGSEINSAGGLRLQRMSTTLQVLATAIPGVTNAPQRATGIRVNSDGTVTIDFLGAPLQTYSVRATANPAAPAWQSIGTNTASTNGTWSFTDPQATNHPSRFYRSALPDAP